jgi:hypothetical protein
MTTFVAGTEPAPARTPGFLVFESLHSLRGTRELATASTRAERARMATIAPAAPRARIGLSLAALLNGAERCIPVQLSNPELWSDIDRAAQMLRKSGGIEAHSYVAPRTLAEIWLPRCADRERVQRRMAALAGDLLELGLQALPAGCSRADCLPAFELHARGDSNFEALLHVPGTGPVPSTVVASLARAISAPLARLAEAAFQPEIQLGVLEVERVRARCSISLRGARLMPARRGRAAAQAASPVLIDQLLQRLGLERRRLTLAALHNAHVLAALAAAASAAGVEPVCFAAEARRHAARWGSCESLVTWRRQGDALLGELELPVDLSSLHDQLRRRAPDATESELYCDARDLAQRVAAVGLSASLAHLRAILIAAAARVTGTMHSRQLSLAREDESQSARCAG